jgi:predicted nucleic acid-binding protein
MARIAVADASPLISFHQIDRLDLLRRVFPGVVAPPAVAREIAPSVAALPPWIREQSPPTIPQGALALDAGEREAIALALHLSAAVILDDLAARKSAARLGLVVVGSVGVLLEAWRRGYVAVVKPDLDAMIANGLYLTDRLYREALDIAGETDH